MRRFKIYINDTEPRYGGHFYMETIEAPSYNAAQTKAEQMYGEGAEIQEIKEPVS